MSTGLPSQKEVSSMWYLLPIFFGIIGGIIAWAVTKDDDPVKAKKFMIFGFVFLILEIVVIAVWYAIALASMMRF